ncbi:MAG TPA: hypothetical protein VGC34_09955 [Steroidobacteraceae bacterium]
MNIQLPNDEIVGYHILALDAEGDVVNAPAGDAYAVKVSDPASLNAVITTDVRGAPIVKFNALVATASGITFEVSDTAGEKVFDGAVDIVVDTRPVAVGLDLTNPLDFGTQDAPPAAPAAAAKPAG